VDDVVVPSAQADEVGLAVGAAILSLAAMVNSETSVALTRD
jgi:hypothetical protein